MQYQGLTLDRFQRQAVDAVERGRSVIVSAPTGTGKTLIADYLIERLLAQDGEVIYTSPIKALSNQKYRQYTKLFGHKAVGLVTGDLVINRDAPVRIMTTEILRNILLEGKHLTPEEEDTDALDVSSDARLQDLDKLQAVIIDEIHFLSDPDRGTVWEELLIYLPKDIQILGLSATLSNLEEFAKWLSQTRGEKVEIVYEPKRSVPLHFLMASQDTKLLPVDRYNKRFGQWRKEQPTKGRGQERGAARRDRGGAKRDSTRHIHVIEMLSKTAYPALYFIFSRAMVERLALDLTNTRTGKKLAPTDMRTRIEERLNQFEQDHPDVLTRKLRRMYKQGIAFHHAGLHVALKNLVEELYEQGNVRVLYCTSTFALGINMPARTVIFDALTKYDGSGIVPLTVREFMQMAGRAGRRGIDTEGDIIMRQDFRDYAQVQPLIEQLLKGESEPVTSAFNLSFHAVANLLDRFDEEQIRDLLKQSFKAFQSVKHADSLRAEIAKRQERIDTQAEVDEDPTSKRGTRQRRHRKTLSTLRRQLAEEERPRLWEEFSRKVEFLRSYGYIDAHGVLGAAALILKKIKMEEIFMTQMVVHGALEALDPADLYGVMCGLVQTLPRTAKVHRPEERWYDLVAPLAMIHDSEIVMQAAKLTGHEPVFTPELMPLGARWARGASLKSLLAEIDNPTDLSGDLVGALRRAKDLIGQLRHVYFEDEATRQELTVLMRTVSRDEVEVLS